MKVLVIGSKGQTGRVLAHLARKAGHECRAVDKEEIDISDRTQVDRTVVQFQPSLIINAAAYNGVDAAEDDADSAYSVNGLAPAYLALAARRLGAVMVHYSTDYVFDGEKGSEYLEGDHPNPVSVYGRSKLLGEQAVMEILPSSYVLRTSWVFGPGGGNFVGRLLNLAETGRELKFIDDQLCMPTYAPDLARVTFELVGRNAPFGIYHATGVEAITPFSWAKAILEQAGRDNVLKPVSMAQFKTKAVRPRRAVLSNAKMHSLGIKIPGGPARLADHFSGRIEVG